jgi:hypothetical protein
LSDKLPIWMRKRVPRKTVEDEIPTGVLAVALRFLFGILVALSVYVAIEYPTHFHLTVIAAGATLFVMVFSSRIQCSRKTVGAFILAAVAVNLVMIPVGGVVENNAGAIAMASVILFTGLTGLLLLTRTTTRLSMKAKATVMGTVVAMNVAGPLLYLSASEEGVLGDVTAWLLLAAVPMIFISYMTFLTLVADHRTEQTLPSDKWV